MVFALVGDSTIISVFFAMRLKIMPEIADVNMFSGHFSGDVEGYIYYRYRKRKNIFLNFYAVRPVYLLNKRMNFNIIPRKFY